MAQKEPNGKWYWVLKGYRWRVITTDAFDDSKIVRNVPCRLSGDIKAGFESAIRESSPREHIYLIQWEERARFGSQEWERVASWDGQRRKIYLMGAPSSFDDAVIEALRTIDPSPALG